MLEILLCEGSPRKYALALKKKNKKNRLLREIYILNLNLWNTTKKKIEIYLTF